ncbi:hypothetical protein BG000_007432 [Podila horticola]|nr:hypothetical protein BG000_007432 [Podila horticola]
MTNTGAQPSPKYSRYTMATMYNAMAPNQVDLYQIQQSEYYSVGSQFRPESLQKVADQVVDMLKNITERLYPFAANYSAVVQDFDYYGGISFEHWSFVFMGVLVAIVAVIYALDKFMNNEYSRMDVVKLIEKTTKTPTSEKSMYPRWKLIQKGGSYRVLLRGQLLGAVETSEFEMLTDEDHYPKLQLTYTLSLRCFLTTAAFGISTIRNHMTPTLNIALNLGVPLLTKISNNSSKI